jgi:CubicO group peptidase (beta-lactamase class C family)
MRISAAFCLVAAATSVAAQTLDFSAVDALVAKEMKANGIPGVAIAVVQKDRIVYVKGYGEANVDAHEKVTPTRCSGSARRRICLRRQQC